MHPRARRAQAPGTDLGLSNVTSAQVAEAQTIADIVCVQNHYNLVHREDDALIDELAAKGIAYVPFFPLGGFTPIQSSALSEIAAKLRATPMQTALALLLGPRAQHPSDSGHFVARPSARESERGGTRPAGCDAR
jgi:hypothetical protein